MKKTRIVEYFMIALIMLLFSGCDIWNKVDGNYNVTATSSGTITR